MSVDLHVLSDWGEEVGMLEKLANRTLMKFRMPSWAGVRGWLALLCKKGNRWKG